MKTLKDIGIMTELNLLKKEGRELEEIINKRLFQYFLKVNKFLKRLEKRK